MDDKEFTAQSDACLSRVAAWLEELDPDEVDYTTGDGLVTIEFPDGMKFILSRQSAAGQVWLAAGARAWHYGLDVSSGRWVDDKQGGELFGRLAEVISEQVGHPVDTSAE